MKTYVRRNGSAGSLTVAIPTLGGLDPLTEAGASNGGWLVPIYDTLMRFDPITGGFEPLAESLIPDDTATVWRLVLREGIEFGMAIRWTRPPSKASIDRHRDPANNSASANVAQEISSMDIVDQLTLTFTLAEPWGTFPVALTSAIGHITKFRCDR